MLVAEAGARQDHRRQSRVGDVDRQPVGISTRLPGFEQQRRVDAGTQVEAGAAGGGIARASARPGAGRAGGCRSSSFSGSPASARIQAALARQPRSDLGDQLARQRQLVGARQFTLAVGIDQQQAVVVAAEGGRAEVAQRSAAPACAAASRAHAAAGSRSRRRSRRSTAAGRPASTGSCATAARMSGFSVSSKIGASLPPPFFSLCSADCAGRQSATAAVAMKTSCRARLGQHRLVHLAGGRHIDAAHAARRGERHRTGHQRDLRRRPRARRARSQNPSCRSIGW